jgi:phytoene dehydrogenase-like protein
MAEHNAVVVGAGPNGLAAAIVLASRGWSVRAVEGRDTVGGGCRTAELTLRGFRHDVCSAIHPLAVASPFLRELPLERHGLEWVHPRIALAHPLDDGTAVLLHRSVEETAEGLGADGPSYRRLMSGILRATGPLLRELLAPLRIPRHPLALGRFGLAGLRSAEGLARSSFVGPQARAVFAGLGAHSMLPLDRPTSAAFALLLGSLAHLVGWPLPRSGSQSIADALAAHLRELGGRIETGHPVGSLDELGGPDAVLLDVSPRQALHIAGGRLPQRYQRALERFRYGPGAFKLDWALAGPIPWKAPECSQAGTVHLGGTLEEIAASEAAVWRGEVSARPFVILAQQSLFDPTRAPAGRHTAWAYCHVPNGSSVDVAERIEGQVERFAPGFSDLVLARSVLGPADLERYNPNYVGGDINGGVFDVRQIVGRPVVRWSPYSTPARGLYLCSASTPPGGGVHGMCGYNAARVVLRDFS